MTDGYFRGAVSQRRASKYGRLQKFFQGGGQSRHFAYPFQVSDDATQTAVHKRFTLATPQRKCSMLRQRLQTVLPLRRGFHIFSCSDPFCNPIKPDNPLPKISSRHM